MPPWSRRSKRCASVTGSHKTPRAMASLVVQPASTETEVHMTSAAVAGPMRKALGPRCPAKPSAAAASG